RKIVLWSCFQVAIAIHPHNYSTCLIHSNDIQTLSKNRLVVLLPSSDRHSPPELFNLLNSFQ
ncbi:MAG: hypothetical protein SAJ37_00920, partial [Oscillatoria sp. PMC 1068.18]|nr:hypothetical protein [Oscillatoria sp. PMC 1068.18]